MRAEIIVDEGKKYIQIPFYREDNVNSFFSEYESNMLENSDIGGVPKAIKKTVGDETFLMFCISSYVSLKERFDKEYLDLKMFCHFFEELIKVFENMSVYLLDKNTICLEPEYIFYDEKEKKYVFMPIAESTECGLRKYESLLTFFADVCSVEEKDLLELIFEIFTSLNEKRIEEISFLKEIAGYKYRIQNKMETNEEAVYDDFDVITDEEDTAEEPKIKATFVICIILLLFSFWTSYMCTYEFKYSVVGMAAVLLAVVLMGYEVLKTIKPLSKQKDT